MDEATAQDITRAVKEIIDQIAPETGYVGKYGGEVFVLDPSDDKAFFGGVFTYKDHVSVEFSNGASFDDPHGHLEGGGKQRRHLKLRTPVDVAEKDFATFLKQAIAD